MPKAAQFLTLMMQIVISCSSSEKMAQQTRLRPAGQLADVM